MNITRTAQTQPPSVRNSLVEKTYAPVEERWEVGSDVFHSTEELLNSQKTLKDQSAKYSYVTRQSEVENPNALRVARGVVRGATGAALVGGTGVALGGAVDLLSGFGHAINDAITPWPVSGPTASLAVTLGLAGAGLGLVLGAVEGAMEDPKVIHRGDMTGLLNIDEDQARFSEYARDKDGHIVGIAQTLELTGEPLVSPGGSVSGEFTSLAVAMGAGAIAGLGSALSDSWLKGGTIAGAVPGVFLGGALPFAAAKEGDSLGRKLGDAAALGVGVGMLSGAAGAFVGVFSGAVGQALNIGPAGNVLAGAALAGVMSSAGRMGLFSTH